MKIQEAIWAHYSDVGNTALKARQLRLAETMFTAAAEEAQRGVPDSLRLAHSWFGLAQTHHSQNQSVLAAHYYKKALPVYEKSAKHFATHLAATWDNLAEIHIAQGDFIRANYFYKKSIKVYEKLFGKDSSVLAPRLLRLGYISLQFKEFDEALAYRDRARAVSANSQSASK